MAKEFFEKIFKHDKVSAFPKDFEDSLAQLKITRQCTLDVVESLEKTLRDIQKKEKKDKPNYDTDELGSLARTCEKYQNTFGDGCLTTVLTSTNTAFSIVSKKEKHLRKDAVEQVLNPLKVWAEDDYPKYMKDIKKCQDIHDKMISAGKSVQNKPTPERTKKYESLKNEYNSSFESCKNELDRVKKVNIHHMNCIKLFGQQHTNYTKACDDELKKAQEAMEKSLATVEETKTKTVPSSNSNTPMH